MDGAVAGGAPVAGPRPRWRSVALPAEHGGWGLTFEPVLLGLIVARSGAGLAIGAAAMLAFVARTPAKLVLVDRWRHRSLPRTALAARIALVEVAALVLLLLVAARTADGPFWVPLLAGLPLLGLELWFDMRSRSRRLLPELAGTVGIGSVAAAIVLAGAGPRPVAAAAWLVVVARATASLPFVRFQLRRVKDQRRRRWAQDLAQAGAVALVLAGVALGWLPPAAAVPVALLAVVQLVLARLPAPRAVIVGAQQLVLGLAVAVATGVLLA